MLISFRNTWHEGAVVKAKKQDRIVGFFWESFLEATLKDSSMLLV